MATEKSLMPSSTCLDDIDDALMLEILARGLLNYKAVFQCKSVCKRWQNLISSPIFVSLWKEHRYRDREPQSVTVVINLRNPRREIEDKYMLNLSNPQVFSFDGFELDFLPCSKPGKITGVRIAASCNDLLLCHSIGNRMDLEPRVYYICNPITKHWIAIPPFPSKYPFMRCAAGMVYGEKSFQVVRIHWHDQSRFANCFTAEVFSSETNIWEEFEVRNRPPNGAYILCLKRVFCKANYRSCNMFSWNGILLIENIEGNSIIAYNPLEPKRCHVLDTPTYPSTQYPSEKFMLPFAYGDCDGSLRLLQLGYDGFFRICELKDYKGGEWSIKKEVSFRELLTDDAVLQVDLYENNQVTWMMVLAVDSNDEDTIYFYHERQGRIFSCNLQTKQVKLLSGAIQGGTSVGDCDIAYNVFQFAVPNWPTLLPMFP